MNNIREKIDIFKREAGEKERYNIEQQKIYSAFTKENGKSIRFAITDCKGKNLRVTLDPATEVRKILLKHYQEPTGTVTAKEILNMFDIVRTGTKKKEKGNYVYTKKFVRKRAVYFAVLKLFPNGKDAVLKSFYSNLGYK